MTLNIVMQYYADLSFNANFRQSFRRFWMVGYFIATTKSIAYRDFSEIGRKDFTKV